MKKRSENILLIFLWVVLLFTLVTSVSTAAAQQGVATGAPDLRISENTSFSGVETSAHASDDSVEAETTLNLRASDGKLNYWTVRFTLPEGAQIVSVEDTFGEIKNYRIDGDTLKFETNTGEPREAETVRVEYIVEDAVVEKYGDLKVFEIVFPGFGYDGTDSNTFARITADETILSASHPAVFSSTVTDEEVIYEGEGSATVRFAVGDEGEYDRYAVFGDDDVDMSEADNLYGIVPRAFGFESSVYKHPVVILDDEEYNEIANTWGKGQYRSSGVILLRSSADDVTGTVLHETAHAYNAEALSWSDSTVGWFEEGTSQYIEFLVDRVRGETRRPLFVGNRTRDGERVRPRGTVEELRGYYDGTEFMRSWEPSNTDEDRRRFGYSFSELVVRSYVKENSATALQKTYDDLRDVDSRATTPQEAAGVILDAMVTGSSVLRPCVAESRGETVNCLRRINTMDATVPAYDGVEAEIYAYRGSVADEKRGLLPSLVFTGLLILIVALVFAFARRPTQ